MEGVGGRGRGVGGVGGRGRGVGGVGGRGRGVGGAGGRGRGVVGGVGGRGRGVGGAGGRGRGVGGGGRGLGVGAGGRGRGRGRGAVANVNLRDTANDGRKQLLRYMESLEIATDEGKRRTAAAAQIARAEHALDVATRRLDRCNVTHDEHLAAETNAFADMEVSVDELHQIGHVLVTTVEEVDVLVKLREHGGFLGRIYAANQTTQDYLESMIDITISEFPPGT